MKKILVVSILILTMSAFAFSFGIEIGGGVNMISAFGMSLAIPTLALGANMPIMGAFSLTGQLDALLSASSGNSSMAFMVLGGGRYTFKMSAMNAFVGVDGGVLTNFESGSSMIPVFGLNGGVQFSMFYIKGAMRWMSITSPGETTHPTTVLLSLNELTGGLYFKF